MRFLADENIPRTVVESLRSAGLDTAWIAETSPGAPDEVVLARAQADDRVLLTFDLDFGDLVFKRGAEASRGVVLFRIPVRGPDQLAAEITGVLRSRDDWRGRFSVVEPGQVRMRDLPP